MRAIAAFLALLSIATAPLPPVADVLPPHDCRIQGHIWGHWYRQEAMYYIPEQPAHICTICGGFQNSSGRYMELVKRNGGKGILSADAAMARVTAEVLKDFSNSWEVYMRSPVYNRYKP